MNQVIPLFPYMKDHRLRSQLPYMRESVSANLILVYKKKLNSRCNTITDYLSFVDILLTLMLKGSIVL